LVPFAPGGSSDLLARLVAQRMTADWGQPVIVENKPGAGATLGADQVAKSPADGYTLLLAATHHTIAQNVFKNLPYDIDRDFAPVSIIALIPNMVVVNAKIPANTIQEFVALAKAQPGKLNYGSAGNGSAGHLAFEYLKMATDIFMLHVPYRGTGPMLTDLMAGRLQAAAVGAPALLQFIKAGKLRCIATGTSTRLPQLPDVPTVAEQGYKGFEMTQWYGLLAPSKWPKAHIDRLEQDAIKAARGKVVSDKLSQDTALAVGNSRAEFEAFIKQEQARWKPVIARAKILPEGI
jgi:tripartite-type tricarboxylate transporter receptor subunit TctC